MSRPSRYKSLYLTKPYAQNKAVAIGRKLGKISAARTIAAAGDAQMNRIMASVPFLGGQANLGRRGVGVRGETKAVDIATTTTVFTLNSAVQGILLNPIQEGPGFNQRIGRKTCAKSVYVNGTINNQNFSASQQTETLRVLLVWDYQPNGTNAANAMEWTDLIQGYTGASAASNLTLDGLNLNNRDRFKVLRDEKFYMPYNNNTSLVDGFDITNLCQPTMDETSIKWFVKLPNLETQFNSTSNPITYANINNGALYLILQGSVGAQYGLVWTSRHRYEDN